MDRRLKPVLALLCGLAAAGCSNADIDRAPVRGHVTLDGRPFTGGAITVVTEDGKFHFSGRIGADGSYLVPKAPCGWVRIGVVVPPATAQGPRPKDKVGAPPKPSASRVAPEYSNPETSGFEGEVRKDQDNVIDIAMRSRPH